MVTISWISNYPVPVSHTFDPIKPVIVLSPEQAKMKRIIDEEIERLNKSTREANAAIKEICSKRRFRTSV